MGDRLGQGDIVVDRSTPQSQSYSREFPPVGNIFGLRPQDVVVELNASDLSYGRGSGPKIIGNYMLGVPLGEGSYGKVKEALHIPTRQPYAVKIIRQRQLKKIRNGEENVRREIMVMQRLRHPNVMRLHEVLTDEHQEKLYMIMEFIDGGSLDQLRELKPHKILMESEARWFFKQMIVGLMYIHQQGIVHRDLKPDNMLITKDGILKISDFSTAFAVEDLASGSGVQGSPAVTPPEVASGQTLTSGFPGDVWAVGVCLYMMVTGKFPFAGTSSLVEMFDAIARVDYPMPDHLSTELQNLLRGLLALPEKRIGLEDVLVHPWYTKPATRVAFNHHRTSSFDNLRAALSLDYDDYSPPTLEDMRPSRYDVEMSSPADVSSGSKKKSTATGSKEKCACVLL